MFWGQVVQEFTVRPPFNPLHARFRKFEAKMGCFFLPKSAHLMMSLQKSKISAKNFWKVCVMGDQGLLERSLFCLFTWEVHFWRNIWQLHNFSNCHTKSLVERNNKHWVTPEKLRKLNFFPKSFNVFFKYGRRKETEPWKRYDLNLTTPKLNHSTSEKRIT